MLTRLSGGGGVVQGHQRNAGPVVSILMPTFNRPRYLAEALGSVLRQSYRNLQIIVVNDGGQDVSDVVRSFDDGRVVFINRKDNRGKAFSLNEALARAEGKYVAYLDDDDLYYPNHIETLVNVLETRTDCQVAYSDLYKVYCRVQADGSRQVLSKVVEVSRDFDRFFMLYFNHALHVCVMHHRSLIEKTGPYNEDLTILIDWDMTRRFAFFTDFYHVCEITGEFYSPSGESDRISVQHRKDKNAYLSQLLTIRTTRPKKPWPKVKDLSVIVDADKLDKQAGQTIGKIWRHGFYPYRVYLPLVPADMKKLDTAMPNLILVAVDPLSSRTNRIDAALARCDGDYVAVVPSGFTINEMWVEDPLYALINNPTGGTGFEVQGSTEELFAVVVTKSDLQEARKRFPQLTVRQSLEAAGITLRKPCYEELPFQFDDLLRHALLLEKEGNWAEAARIFLYTAEHFRNELWMKTLAAKALYKAGDHGKALELSRDLNRRRPTVDTLLLEAKVSRAEKKFERAIELLERAERALIGSSDYLDRAEVEKCGA